MKIAKILIISIASILIVAICAGTILRLHEKPADIAKLTDKDKIEMLVTLNSHRLELVKTIMDGDTIFSDQDMKALDELTEKWGWKYLTGHAARVYRKSKKAKLIIEDALFLERAMTSIVMNDSLLNRKLEIEAGF